MLPGSDIPEGPDNDLHPSSSREITSEPLTLFAGILAFLAVSLWGGNTVSIKIASAGVPPAAIAAARFALGALAVFIYSRTTGVSLTLFRAEISPNAQAECTVRCPDTVFEHSCVPYSRGTRNSTYLVIPFFCCIICASINSQ